MNGTSYIIFIDTVTPLSESRGNPADYRPVVCGVSNGFNMSFESIAHRSKCDGGWDNTDPGYGSWGLSMDGQAIGVRNAEATIKANFQEIALLAAGKRKFWAKMADLDSTMVREGIVWISSYNETADMDTAYSFTVEFVGCGVPIIETDIYTLLLATDIGGLEIVEDGENNLIEDNDGN